MNEHSSGTRTTVPPSLSDSGTEPTMSQFANKEDYLKATQPEPTDEQLWTAFFKTGALVNPFLARPAELTNGLWRVWMAGRSSVAPDQGSVRNATDEQDAKRYRALRARFDGRKYSAALPMITDPTYLSGWVTYSDGEALDEAVDAAIRALPDQKD